jgi:hypothetical protein
LDNDRAPVNIQYYLHKKLLSWGLLAIPNGHHLKVGIVVGVVEACEVNLLLQLRCSQVFQLHLCFTARRQLKKANPPPKPLGKAV